MRLLSLVISPLLCFIFISSSCQSEAPAKLPTLPTNQVDEDALLSRLSPLIYANPDNAQAIAQNELINYAIDNKLDVRPTGSGLFIWIVDPGQGSFLEDYSQQLEANYIGRLLDGTIFDQSKPNRPISFRLNQMIHGWSEGVQLLGEGGHAVMLIPPALAYGDDGVKGLVPANACLRFDMQVGKGNVGD